MNRTETIQNLTEGLDPLLVQWLSLEDWETLPTEGQLADIAGAWDAYADDEDGFSRYVRNLMGENMYTSTEIAHILTSEPESRRMIVSFDFPDGESAYVAELEERFDVYDEVIYDALCKVQADFRRNF